MKNVVLETKKDQMKNRNTKNSIRSVTGSKNRNYDQQCSTSANESSLSTNSISNDSKNKKIRIE